MSIYREKDKGSRNNGTIDGKRGRIGLVLAGATAIILLFILSDTSQAQPRALIRLSPQKVPRNQELHVTLEITWSGDVDAYDIQPIDVSPLAEFQVMGRSLSAERRDGNNVLRYEIALQPLKEGEYDMSRIRVEYLEKNNDKSVRIPLPHTMVTVLPPRLIPGGAKAATGIGALVILGAIATTIFVRRIKDRRQGSTDALTATQQRRDEFLAELEGALALRIEGDIGAYMDKLCALAHSNELEPHVHRLDQLRELTESAKFGGLVLSPDQFAWAEKKVKDAIGAAFPIDSGEAE